MYDSALPAGPSRIKGSITSQFINFYDRERCFNACGFVIYVALILPPAPHLASLFQEEKKYIERASYSERVRLLSLWNSELCYI